jgi:hypothetical protein
MDGCDVLRRDIILKQKGDDEETVSRNAGRPSQGTHWAVIRKIDKRINHIDYLLF